MLHDAASDFYDHDKWPWRERNALELVDLIASLTVGVLPKRDRAFPLQIAGKDNRQTRDCESWGDRYELWDSVIFLTGLNTFTQSEKSANAKFVLPCIAKNLRYENYAMVPTLLRQRKKMSFR